MLVVDFALLVKDKGHNIADYPAKAAQTYEQLSVRLIKVSEQIDCARGESAGRVCFTGEDARPKLLHLAVGDDAALVKEICDPVVRHVLRVGLILQKWQRLSCNAFDVRLPLRFLFNEAVHCATMKVGHLNLRLRPNEVGFSL